ncbi:hypothetical protein ACFX1X_007898 [Malus domestica]
MWRGVVVGQPVRGRLTDKRVTMIREVKDQEEWEKIEQFEMSQDFGKRSEQLVRSKGRKYFWVFVRHPRWRFSDLPWQQWTLVCEVVVEGEKQRLDKWSLMGRLGNLTRSLIVRAAEEELSEEKDEKYWGKELEKAVSSSDADAMEKLAKQSVKATTEYFKKQLRTMERNKNRNLEDKEESDGDETTMRGKRPTVSAEE